MRTIYTSCLLTIAALAVATSCGKSDTPAAASGPVDVRLVVSSGNNTRVGSDETDNNISQLRVYAFKGDTKVGYAEADNLKGQNYIPITLSEGGDINFYVIANDNFGPKPTVDAAQFTDWASLSKANLESLKFDLSGFSGWSATDDFVSPMSNNLKDEFGNDLENNNAYSNPVTVTKPTSGSLVIPVTVQHVLGRLRLMLNKESDDVTITLKRAAVYNRPDYFLLYNSGSADIKYDNNKSLVDEFVVSDIPLGTTQKEVARTYLAPNLYGSSDPDTYTAQKTDGTTSSNGLNEAYRLDLTVEFAYSTRTSETKNYKVYLPRVPRNTSIDVQGTFKGTVVKPEFNVMTEAWVEKVMDIPEFE